jgi:FecR protein
MECSEALDLLYESFDGQITPAAQAQLNGHRRTCFACAGTLAKAQRFQDLLRRVPQLSVPRGLEARVIEHVLHKSPKSLTQPTNIFRREFSWHALLRPALASGGVLAAAIAVFFVVHSMLSNTFHRPVDQTIVATVQGSLQDVAPNAATHEVDSTDTPLSTGEVLRPVGSLPAIISITPHLALIMSSGSEVQISKLHYDQSSGLADAIFLQLRRGTLRVNEILHRDVSPVHVATTQATFTPTGTTFSVSAKSDSTDLAVTAGSVEVQMPGRVFDVIAGHGVHITANDVVRSLLVGKHHHHKAHNLG